MTVTQIVETLTESEFVVAGKGYPTYQKAMEAAREFSAKYHKPVRVTDVASGRVMAEVYVDPNTGAVNVNVNR